MRNPDRLALQTISFEFITNNGKFWTVVFDYTTTQPSAKIIFCGLVIANWKSNVKGTHYSRSLAEVLIKRQMRK